MCIIESKQIITNISCWQLLAELCHYYGGAVGVAASAIPAGPAAAGAGPSASSLSSPIICRNDASGPASSWSSCVGLPEDKPFRQQ